MRERKAEIKQQQAPVAARMEDFDAAVYWPPRSDGNCLKPPEKNREQQQNSNTGDINLLREMNELLEATNPISNLMIVFLCFAVQQKRNVSFFCCSATKHNFLWFRHSISSRVLAHTKTQRRTHQNHDRSQREWDMRSQEIWMFIIILRTVKPRKSKSFMLIFLSVCLLSCTYEKKLTHKFYENWNFGQASAAADASVWKSWKNRKLFFGYSRIPSRTGNWI